MSISTPPYIHPAFQLRGGPPVIRPFPKGRGSTSKSPIDTSPTSQRPRTSPGHRSVVLKKKSESVEQEYVRNLEHQIYLLEMETRFLRSRRPDAADGGGSLEKAVDMGSIPLNDAIKNLKYKYVELQETHKSEMKNMNMQLDKLRTDLKLATLDKEAILQQKADFQSELSSLKTTHTDEKDKLYMDIHQLHRTIDTQKAEIARLDLSYNRCVEEKAAALHQLGDRTREVERLKAVVDEQIQMNDVLKSKVDDITRKAERDKEREGQGRFTVEEHEYLQKRLGEVQSENVTLRTQIANLEQQLSVSDSTRVRLTNEVSELLRKNVQARTEVEEAEMRLKREVEKRETGVKREKGRQEAEGEVERLKAELRMEKIKVESKERKLTELEDKIKTSEDSLYKALEARTMLTERVTSLESRLQTHETTLIQLSQDKALLTDDLTSLQHTLSLKSTKLDAVTSENQALQVQIDKYQRDVEQRGEFTKLLKEVECSGQNYLGLMRTVREYLGEREGCEDEENTMGWGRRRTKSGDSASILRDGT
ncbi:hypothetical protein HDU85_003850 [Gaertneriomyces sp. JEL0708]|nr:hypothetical protein HDU85_003850 [Gaertneriomyces sp. JEL0708]